MKVTPNGYILTQSEKSIKLWHPRAISKTVDIKTEASCVVASPDNEFVFFFDSKLRCFNLQTNSEILIS